MGIFLATQHGGVIDHGGHRPIAKVGIVNSPPAVKIQGVYAIRNRITARQYVGSSVDIYRRIAGHMHMLRRGTHENAHLQRAWHKYGAIAFTTAILETVPDKADLLMREQFFLDIIQQKYNIAARADRPPRFDNRGVKASPETRAKMSATRRGMDNSRLWSPTAIAKRIETMRGRTHSMEHCARISAAMKMHIQSVEHRARVSAALRGKTKSPEHRARLSAAGKTSPVALANSRRNITKALAASVEANTGAKRSDAFRARMKANKKAFWASDASVSTRQLIIEAAKRRQATLSPEQVAANVGRMRQAISPAERSVYARRAANAFWASEKGAMRRDALTRSTLALSPEMRSRNAQHAAHVRWRA